MSSKRFVQIAGLGLALAWAVVAETQPQSELVLGKQVYEANCAVCHGVQGDGRGEAASRFEDAPRDFTKGQYELRSTDSGQLPTDADLIRSIVRGLPGTAMVPQDHLTETEVRAVVAYIKSLSPKFAQLPSPDPIPIPPPPPRTPEAIARGRQVYVKGGCVECHGLEGRGDGPSASDLSEKPADLTQRPLKSGPTPRDIYRSILTGLDGTPMPSYYLTLDENELWDLAYYVDSLGGSPLVTDDERIGWEVERKHQQR